MKLRTNLVAAVFAIMLITVPTLVIASLGANGEQEYSNGYSQSFRCCLYGICIEDLDPYNIIFDEDSFNYDNFVIYFDCFESLVSFFEAEPEDMTDIIGICPDEIIFPMRVTVFDLESFLRHFNESPEILASEIRNRKIDENSFNIYSIDNIVISFDCFESYASFFEMEPEEKIFIIGICPDEIIMPITVTILDLEVFLRFFSEVPDILASEVRNRNIDVVMTIEPFQTCAPGRCGWQDGARFDIIHNSPNMAGCQSGQTVIVTACRLCGATDSRTFLWVVPHSSNTTIASNIVHGNVHPGYCNAVTTTTERCRNCHFLISSSTQTQSFWCFSTNIFGGYVPLACEEEFCVLTE